MNSLFIVGQKKKKKKKKFFNVFCFFDAEDIAL